MDNFLFASLGTLIGLFVGIMPSIGGSFILLACFAFLIALSPLQVLIFYVTFRISSQFSGSVSALLFGLLGEITSYPALRERANLIAKNLILTGATATAVGSTLATLSALCFTYLMLFQIDWTPYFLRSEMVFFVLVLVVVISCFWPGNNLYQNTFFVVFGFMLGIIGFDPITGKEFLTFGNVYLSAGIPLLPLLMGFIAVPVAYKILHDRSELILLSVHSNPSRLTLESVPWWSVARGTAVGWVAGLIPVIGSTMSSNMAWRFETWLQKKTGKDNAVARLVSAESANNSAVISVLIPLLLFGIAIIPSEMIVFYLLEAQGWNYQQFSQSDYFLVTGASVISVTVSYLLCAPWISILGSFFSRHHDAMTYIVLSVTLVSVLLMGYREFSMIYYAVLLVLFSYLGILLRYQDLTPLILSFLAADQLLQSSRVIYQLYS